MAYVAPTTRADGYVVDATEWNKNTVDNPIALKALIDALGSSAATRCDGRLTLTTGVPVTNADVTAATTLYFAPYRGNQIALYDGSSVWNIVNFTELSIAVPATTNQMYDVFVYSNAGTATLELTAWTNDSTRATALTTQNGVLVKTGATTRRFVGCMRTTTVSGQTEDSKTKRFVYSYANRVPRQLQQQETTSTWTYSTATWRQQRNTATNQVELITGVAECPLVLLARAMAANDTGGGVVISVGIGEDSTTAPVDVSAVGGMNIQTANQFFTTTAQLSKVPAVGYHKYCLLEGVTASGSTTWVGAGSSAVATTAANGTGLFGTIDG